MSIYWGGPAEHWSWVRVPAHPASWEAVSSWVSPRQSQLTLPSSIRGTCWLLACGLVYISFSLRWHPTIAGTFIQRTSWTHYIMSRHVPNKSPCQWRLLSKRFPWSDTFGKGWVNQANVSLLYKFSKTFTLLAGTMNFHSGTEGMVFSNGFYHWMFNLYSPSTTPQGRNSQDTF